MNGRMEGISKSPVRSVTGVKTQTYPDEQLGHDDVSQLAGSVKSGAGERRRSGGLAVDLLLGAVGQKQQQLGQISVSHRRQQPRRHVVLRRPDPRGRPKRRHKCTLLVLGTDPGLPLLSGETETHENINRDPSKLVQTGGHTVSCDVRELRFFSIIVLLI